MKNCTPGYTRGFRKAIGLDYQEPELTPQGTFQSDDPGLGFRVIKKPHADPIFLSEIPEKQKDFLGHRLTQQMVGTKIHRRMFGASAFYANPNAGTDDVDDAAMVSSPEVFLPVNSSDRLLFSMEVPDFVVTAVMSLKAADDVVMFHSLRYIPRIRFVKLEELPGIYNSMVERSRNLPAQGIAYPGLERDLATIKAIIDHAK